MKSKYPVKMLCELLDVSRSGYYKWLKRKGKPNIYERDRQILTELLQEEHRKHPSYGYHRLAQAVINETGWLFSHNLAHKCCKQAGIYSLARKHRKYLKPGEESVKFPNLVKGRWSVNRPHVFCKCKIQKVADKNGESCISILEIIAGCLTRFIPSSAQAALQTFIKLI